MILSELGRHEDEHDDGRATTPDYPVLLTVCVSEPSGVLGQGPSTIINSLYNCRHVQQRLQSTRLAARAGRPRSIGI